MQQQPPVAGCRLPGTAVAAYCISNVVRRHGTEASFEELGYWFESYKS